MATVYLAEDVKHHRRVAVKVLRPELAEIARLLRTPWGLTPWQLTLDPGWDFLRGDPRFRALAAGTAGGQGRP